MTAEVAILNTHGVALAADSAVTVRVGGENKVYNTANKLFALSKYRPIGIMIYNKAAYMGIDWEILIKEFRKKLNKEKCDSLFGYADKFINYIKEYAFFTEDQQKKVLLSICKIIVSLVRNSFFHALKDKFKSTENITLRQAASIFDSVINNIQKQLDGVDNQTNYTLDVDFIEKNKVAIIGIIDELFEKYKTSIKQKESILEIIKSDVKKANSTYNYSGIVIVGYGDKDIFPSIYQCEICGKIGNSFILVNEKKHSISYEDTAFIAPFAQSEMVHTFMRGIDPDIQEAIDNRLNNLMMAISDIIGKSYKNKLIKIKDEFMDHLIDLQHESYINPIMDIVESLQKIDLAEMAETLVNLTAFKRHVSKNAETVGGPTDVAVITKGDGFVWIKRKHYFDIKLNQSFLKNYFMEDTDD